MSEQIFPWIQRELANNIYTSIVSGEDAVEVFLVEAKAGKGKTYLARDIGHRLGSPTGYEKASHGNLAWSGILDLYDPDTNSNRGIERRLIEGIATSEFDFDKYHEARELYDAYFKSGISGSGLEEQRHKVEEAFAEGLRQVAKKKRPILVFDTIERTESALDPTQQEIGFFDDTASVSGWLIYQITILRRGVIILLGRKADRFFNTLKAAIEKANRERQDSLPIRLHRKEMEDLNQQEMIDFFKNRKIIYPRLKELLTPGLEDVLMNCISGNPLLLDLALQALLEIGNPITIKDALLCSDGLRNLDRVLINTYMNSFKDPDRQILLQYLALARNGLFSELLISLEPQRADQLVIKLDEMKDLPYIKVRVVTVAVPGSGERCPRVTYFLHDAMYNICDDVLLRPQQVVEDTKKIVSWYDQQINIYEKSHQKSQRSSGLYIVDPDLLVESLFYRMRADPQDGYNWYLQQADRAIRSAQTGLDMRLGDALAFFLASASEEGETGISISSKIDRSSIQFKMPHIFDDYSLDNATVWIKRATLRGKSQQAVEIGETKAGWAKLMYEANPNHYQLAYAEFLLWYAQAMMYGFDIENALEIYRQVVLFLSGILIKKNVQSKQETRENKFEYWRASLVLGRAYNNMGYTHWVYQGKYKLALQELKQAIHIWRNANLEEELANSSDNMGRVFALQGQEYQSIRLIQNGLEIRSRLGMVYREALSYTSLAQVYIRFGQPEQARRAVESSLIHFGRVGVERGVGLGLLTRGMLYRTMSELHTELDLPIKDALRFTDLAENDLREAIRIFTFVVKEPIREVQARNEMGCSYRARYLLLIESEASDVELDLAFTQARQYFRQAIELAGEYHYKVDELDSIQDLSVLFARAKRYEEAERYLNEVRAAIPESHKIQEGRGLPELAIEESVDAYYKLMGQVELLAGAIEYEKGRPREYEMVQGEKFPSRNALLRTAHQYLLAVSYFSMFSGETHTRRLTFDRIYKRFERCDPEFMREINTIFIPKWIKTYQLPEKMVGSLTNEIFGLFE